ncbi:hypothetical protein Q8A73_008420 [Channa argus]|nr:hypothetical protein Q8A73_008420 [Channa argus]
MLAAVDEHCKFLYVNVGTQGEASDAGLFALRDLLMHAPPLEMTGTVIWPPCCSYSISCHLQLDAERTKSTIDRFYIVVEKQLIPCQSSSFLAAFDELFKSHFVFKLSYEDSLIQMFTFFQRTI